jgi:peptide/nickel transport system substrate-binding protein/oligopeptide transport system substrate-binding protein
LKKRLLESLLAVCLLGCSREAAVDNTLHLALETSPNKLDPALVVDVAEGQLCSLIFQRLVRFSPEGVVVPDAAASWETLDAGKRYVFHLDPRARFSTGRRVLSSDVVASFARVLGPDSRSSRQWVLARIGGAGSFTRGVASSVSGLSAPDDSTVTIELEEPFRPFLQLLAMPAASIVPVDLAEAAGDGFAADPLGSGQWQLAGWNRGDYLSLVPNPYYPGTKPALDEIRFRIIPEAFTRIAEFEAGTLDMLKVPLAELPRFLQDDERKDRLQSRPELRVLYIGLNNNRGPLQDARVRRALNMAVDVDQLIEVLHQGHATRAAGAIPPSLGGFRNRDAYPYDPAQARRLLAEAGFPEGFAMEIWQRDSPEGNRLVEAVQGYLRQAGVTVTIVKREWSAFKEAVSQGRVDAFFLDWYADYPDAENFLFPLFHSQNAGPGGNRAFIREPRVDELIERAQRTDEPETGLRLYASADSLVYDLAPWIYLYFPTTFLAVSPRIDNYVFPVVYLGENFSSVQKLSKGNR